MLVAHLSNMIRDLPCDLSLFANEGFEHRHKQRKFEMRNNNLHKPACNLGAKRKRAAFMKKSGGVTRAHFMRTGKSRQQQSLEKCLVRDWINRVNKKFSRVAQDQLLVEKNKLLKSDLQFQSINDTCKEI